MRVLLAVILIYFVFKTEAKFEINYVSMPLETKISADNEIIPQRLNTKNRIEDNKINSNIRINRNDENYSLRVNEIIDIEFVNKRKNGFYKNDDNQVIQLGAFLNPLNASRFYKKMKSKLGDSVFVIKPTSKNNQQLIFVVKEVKGDINSEVENVVSTVNIEPRIKKLIYEQEAKNVALKLNNYEMISKIEVKPKAKLIQLIDEGEKLDLEIKPKKFNTVPNETLLFTLNSWVGKSIKIEFTGIDWIKDIVIKNSYEFDSNLNKSIGELLNKINTHSEMAKRNINLKYKLDESKLEVYRG